MMIFDTRLYKLENCAFNSVPDAQIVEMDFRFNKDISAQRF